MQINSWFLNPPFFTCESDAMQLKKIAIAAAIASTVAIVGCQKKAEDATTTTTTTTTTEASAPAATASAPVADASAPAASDATATATASAPVSGS